MDVDRSYSESVRWPDRRRGPWTVVLHFVGDRGYVRLVGLDLSSDPPAELTSSVWRALPLGRLADEAYAQVLKTAELITYQPGVDPRKGARMVVGAKAGARRGDVAPLAEVAEVYRAHRRKPTQAVADHFGIAHSTAAKRVAAARAKKLLEPTSQGRVSGPRTRKKGTGNR